MNILILSPSLAVGGGAERFAVNLGNELYKLGYNIHHLAFFDKDSKYGFKGKYSSLNDIEGIKGIFPGMVSLLQKSRLIKKYCINNNISTIISIGENANLHAILSKYFFKNNVKIIATQHINPEIHFKDKISFRLIKFFYPKADIVVCVSKGIENALNGKYQLNNTQTIYNFVDLDYIDEMSKENLPVKYKSIFKSGFIFINIGRLSEQKGQWFLIRSFRKVVDEYQDAKLCILGEGELKNELNNLIKKLDLNENVFLLGNQENVFPFLKNSDVFVLTSLWEGFPMTLIETLSVNLPIISTDCKNGPREILSPEIDINERLNYPYVGKYGILIKSFERKYIFETVKKAPLDESEQILTKIMKRIIEDHDLEEKYYNGTELVKKLDKSLIINEWKNIIESKLY